MKTTLIRRAAAVLMTAVLLASGGAQASTGDRIIRQAGRGGMPQSSSIQQAVLAGEKVYLYLRGSESSIETYDLAGGETASYDLTELEDRMSGLTENGEVTEDGHPVTESIGFFFALDGALYAEVNRTESLDRGSRVDGGYLRKVDLRDGRVSLSESGLPKLDWSGLIDRNGDWEFARYVSSAAAAGGWLAAVSGDDTGEMALQLFDLTTGEHQQREFPDLSEIGPGPDGKLMTAQYRWGDASEMIVSLYDPADGAAEELARFNLEQAYPRCVAWQPETDTLYYLLNGEIFAAPGRDLAAARSVNDCALGGSTLAQLTDSGDLLIWGYDGAMLKSTDPAKRGEIELRVRPFTWTEGMDEAYYAFTAVRGDVSVVLEQQGDPAALMQGMMNRDDRVDIYVISRGSAAFQAVMDRGFAADLSGDEKLTAAVEKLYPAVRDAVKKDGKLLAVPLQLTGEGFGYNRQAWEKLGLTEADLPRTWSGLLDLLETLPEKLDGTEFRAFDLYTTQADLRRSLAQRVMQSYALMRPEEGFRGPELSQLLERISRLNLDALDVLTDETVEMTEDLSAEPGADRKPVLDRYFDLGVTGFYEQEQALALAFSEGEEAYLPAELTVAFINPYSRHIPEAMAYLETMMEHLGVHASYALRPEWNEPLRYPDFESQKRMYTKYLEQARRNLEKDDGEDAANWKQIAEYYQRTLDEFDDSYWVVAPEEIAAYRQRAERLVPVRWNFWDQLNQEDGGAAFQEIWEAYLEGRKPAAELLNYVDQKVRMMRMEGN